MAYLTAVTVAKAIMLQKNTVSNKPHKMWKKQS